MRVSERALNATLYVLTACAWLALAWFAWEVWQTLPAAYGTLPSER